MSEETRHLSMSEDPVFIDLLAQALEAAEENPSVDLAGICAERPDLIPELEAALAGADNLSELHQSAAGFDPLLGQTIGGRYALRDRLGSGGMGVVYRAEDTELRRDVAVKMLRPDVMTGEELEQRLTREAEVLASVTHPAIISVFDRGRSADDRAYVVMPVLEGLSGSELIEAAPNADPTHPEVNGMGWVKHELGGEGDLESNFVRQAACWIAQIARGLAVIHEAGVVHRDVKPSNIFIQRDGNPLLLDFGLVTLGADTTLAQRDSALGTPAYMAPEQLDPRVEPTPAIDIYGLCATLYHFLTFERPFRGSASQVLAALQRREPRPAGSIRPGLPRDLLAILERGMAKEPKNRYPSARALAEDLEAWLDFRPVTARPVSGLQRVARRTWRNPVAKTLVVVGVLGFALLGTSLWIEARDRAREALRIALEEEHTALRSHVPTTVLITQPPSLRANADPALRATLARLAATDATPGEGHLLFALHQQQQGHPKEAAATLLAVAAAHESDLIEAIAKRVDASTPGAPISMDSLREPETDLERLNVATQLLWVLNGPNITRAQALADACSPNLVGAAEIGASIQFRMAQMGSTALYREKFDALIERIVAIESSRGSTSASLQNTLGMAMIALGRPNDAIQPLIRAAELAPSDYSHWINLGAAYQVALDAENAEGVLHHALTLAPRSNRAREVLVRIAINQGDFEVARTRVRDIPRASSHGLWLGRILLQEACAVLLSPAPAENSDEAIATARQQLREAYDLFKAGHRPGTAPSWEMLLCKTIEDPETHFPVLVDEFLRLPMDWARVREIGLLIPLHPDDRAATALRRLILSLSAHLAPTPVTNSELR